MIPPRFLTVLLAVVLSGAAGLPRPLPGQVAGEPPVPQAAVPGGAAAFRLTSIADGARPLWGGWVGVRIGRELWIGGAGFDQLAAAPLAGRNSSPEMELDIGYGGVVVRRAARLDSSWRWSVGLLLGAGNGRVRNRLGGGEVATDNFAVAEPDVVLARRIAGSLRIAFGAGYRFVAAVDDLPGLGGDALDGPFLGVRVQIEGG